MVLLINKNIEFELLNFEKLLSESKIFENYFSYEDFICSIDKNDENYKKLQSLNNDNFISILLDDNCNIISFIHCYITSIKFVDNIIDFYIHFSFSKNINDSNLIRKYKLKNILK